MAPFVGENINKANKDPIVTITRSQLSDPLVILNGLEGLFTMVAESSKHPSAFTSFGDFYCI